MKTRLNAIGRYLLLSAFSADMPWMLALLAAGAITRSTTVLIAFWVALVVRFASDLLASRVDLERLADGGTDDQQDPAVPADAIEAGGPDDTKVGTR